MTCYAMGADPAVSGYEQLKTSALSNLDQIIRIADEAYGYISPIVDQGFDRFTREAMDEIAVRTWELNSQTDAIIAQMKDNPYFMDKTVPEVKEKWDRIDFVFMSINNRVNTTLPWMEHIASVYNLTIPTIGARDVKPTLSEQTAPPPPPAPELTIEDIIAMKSYTGMQEEVAAPGKVSPVAIVAAALAAYLVMRG